jgi:hypothetical protein
MSRDSVVVVVAGVAVVTGASVVSVGSVTEVDGVVEPWLGAHATTSTHRNANVIRRPLMALSLVSMLL